MSIKSLEFNTEAGAHDYMSEHAARKGHRLASGVGNDMSRPFYLRQNSWSYIWYPDGISGAVLRVGFSVRLSEYNPDV